MVGAKPVRSSERSGFRKLTPKSNAHAEIMGLLSDVMVGLRADDHINLPPVVPSSLLGRDELEP